MSSQTTFSNYLDYSYLSANWVLPVTSQPKKQAIVVLKDDYIFDIWSKDEFDQRLTAKQKDELRACQLFKDYKEAVILPGLINLHTHLDYSALGTLKSSKFFDWIMELVKGVAHWQANDWKNSALAGAKEIALSGTTCVADSSYSGAAAWALAQIGLRGVVGLELFGIDDDSVETKWQNWLEKYKNFMNSAEQDEKLKQSLKKSLLQITVSPHSPYTVSPALMSKASKWSENKNLPCFIHLAESKDECDWICSVSETVDQYLSHIFKEDMSKIKSLNWKGKGLSPIAHLDKHKILSPLTVAAHLVHLNDEDISLLSKNQVKMAHCPRSNSKLGNGSAPLKKLLEAKLELGFGTDSAASCDDLNVLHEAQFALNRLRTANPSFNMTSEQAIYHLTYGAAKTIGLAERIGSLESGKQADIVVFGLKNSLWDEKNPYDLILSGDGALIDLFVAGRKIINEGVIIN